MGDLDGRGCRAQAGLASGLINTAQQFGGAMGDAALAAALLSSDDSRRQAAHAAAARKAQQAHAHT